MPLAVSPNVSTLTRKEIHTSARSVQPPIASGREMLMRERLTSRKQRSSRLILALFLMTALLLPPAITEAQYRQRGPRRTGQQGQSSAEQATTEQTQGTRRGRRRGGASEATTGQGQPAAGKEAPVTVTGRVSQRALSAAAIQAITKN